MPEPCRHCVSVAAVVIREDGKILVIRRRDTGQYQAPGGILERDAAAPGPGRRAERGARLATASW